MKKSARNIKIGQNKAVRRSQSRLLRTVAREQLTRHWITGGWISGAGKGEEGV